MDGLTDTQEIKREISLLKDKVTEQEADLKEVTKAVWQLTRSIGQLSESVKLLSDYMQSSREKGIAQDKDFQAVVKHLNILHDELEEIKEHVEGFKLKATYFTGALAVVIVIAGLLWNYVSPHVAGIITMEKRISILEVQHQKHLAEYEEMLRARGGRVD